MVNVPVQVVEHAVLSQPGPPGSDRSPNEPKGRVWFTRTSVMSIRFSEMKTHNGGFVFESDGAAFVRNSTDARHS